MYKNLHVHGKKHEKCLETNTVTQTTFCDHKNESHPLFHQSVTQLITLSWALIKFAQCLVFPRVFVEVCCSWCCFWRVKLQLSQEITPIAPQSVLQPQSIVITSTTASMQGQTRKLKLFFKK